MPRLRATLTLLLGFVVPLRFTASAAEPAAATPASASAAVASSWPVVPSDLPADPALRQGTLPNGLRYLILPNAEPKNHVSLRLIVDAGSLHEREDERGLAHFVEHMAFRGTRAFPAGALTAALQRLGVALGPDSTAFTTPDHTIYHLELPDAGGATLHEGLRAFREYAENVTFDGALIEKERGVVLSELATRETPQTRAGDYNLRFLWPRALEVRRKPIGEPALLRTFTRDQFTAFYDAWYRPERMAVIVVGDLDPAAAERGIADHFATLAARAPARPVPADLRTTETAPPDVGVFADPGLIGVVLTFEHAVLSPRPADIHARRVAELRTAVAFGMFHARLQKLAAQPEATFISPVASYGPGIRDWQVAALSASAKIDDWPKAAAQVEQEHRRAIQLGFTARELDEARTAFAAGYTQAVRTAPTRPSSWLAQQLAGVVLYGGTFCTPAAAAADLAADLAALTLADCTAAFRAAWSNRAPSVFIAAHPAFAITRQQIAAMLNDSRQIAVAALPETAAPKFAYTDFGSAGRLEQEEHLADLDVRLARFANGVRLNFKSTGYEADVVEVRVRVGDGRISQPENQPGLDLLGAAVVMSGGLGRHRIQDVATLFIGRSLSVNFRIDSDACVFAIRAAPRDLTFGLQLVAAYLSDAAFRPESMRDATASFNSMFASLAASPGGPISVRAQRELFHGDRRFGLPEYDELHARNLDELAAWLKPQFATGPLELSLVGDVAWEEASAAVAATLGALPARADVATKRKAPGVAFASKPPAPQRIYAMAEPKPQMAMSWFWPVPVVADIHEERRCYLLAAVLTDRLRLRLREELGATYAPIAGFTHVEGFPGANFFSFYAELAPALQRKAYDVVEHELDALSRQGPTRDEFDRALQPYLREMNDARRTNDYWAEHALACAQEFPARIAAARDRATDIASITQAEIAALAGRYLAPKQAFKFAAVPPKVLPGPAGRRSN